ncbi:MAG: HAMP domain-containing sensor histidine kinase, partial [Ferruginibacter sp.]
KKDGTEMYVEISLCSYTTEDETLAVAFVTDITLQKTESEKLRNYQESLEQLIVERTAELNAALQREKETGLMKSRFVSLAAHEFRTPLSTVLSSAALINRYNDSYGSAPISKHAERIKSAVQNMTGVLNDFLSLDKLEQGIIEVHPAAFEIPQMIMAISEEMESCLKPGQEIVYEHNGLSALITDPKITHNVLVNLVSNASKYSAEYKQIFIRTAVQDHTAVFEVRDQGIGIPAEEQAHLFSLFYRCSNVGGMQGTGLGLNIVARYVSLLGGTIHFTSTENLSTAFTVTLPSWSL